MSQFSPAVGKRLMFPRSRSLLILVFNLFASCCFTFALAARLFCPDSLLDDFCPRSSPRVPPARWDGHCSPGQMIDVSPRRWRWGLWLRCCTRCPRPLLLSGRRGCTRRGTQPQLSAASGFCLISQEKGFSQSSCSPHHSRGSHVSFAPDEGGGSAGEEATANVLLSTSRSHSYNPVLAAAPSQQFWGKKACFSCPVTMRKISQQGDDETPAEDCHV